MQLVKMALAYAGISRAELARRLGWSPQLLDKRLNTGKFTLEEWEALGDAIGAKVEIHFTFADGKVV